MAVKKLSRFFSGKKNPWLAATLNFLLPGLGYIYAGRRAVFGAGLILVLFVLSFLLFKDLQFSNLTPEYDMRSLAWAVSLNLLFAYDAYTDAKKR